MRRPPGCGYIRGMRRLLLAAAVASLPPSQIRADAAASPRTFSVEELREELALCRRALGELHPSLTWYTPEAELERAFDVAAAQIRQPMTEGQFFELLQPVVVLVRCGHTYVEPSNGFEAWRALQPTSFLPFGLWADGDRLFVLSSSSTDPTIQPGDQLLEVNGVPATTIIDRGKALIPADGFGETWKYVILNLFAGGNLKRVAFRSLGIREPFALVLVGRDGRRATRTVWRKPAPDGGRPPSVGPDEPPSRRFELLANATARLTINRFDYDDEKAFDAGVFQQLEEKKIQHLIIDLRANSGGDGDDALDLMTYLMDGRFVADVDEWAKVRHPESPSFARYLDPETKQRLLDNNRFVRREGGRYYFQNAGLGKHEPSRSHRYRGAVYVLTSGRTFSSASLFVASLKAQRAVTLIGQETGGGRAGCTAGINHKLTLPYTQMRLHIPVFRIRSGDPAPNQGRGVMPDHQIRYGWQDVVAGKDLEMDRAQELIARDGAGPAR
jgi:hypothetical protein